MARRHSANLCPSYPEEGLRQPRDQPAQAQRRIRDGEADAGLLGSGNRPFLDVRGRYRFRFALEAGRIGVWIRYDDGAGGGLATALPGERRRFTDAELLRVLARGRSARRRPAR